MARKTHASSLEQNLDEQLEALRSARDEAERQKAAASAVSEQAGKTVPQVVVAAARRPARRIVLLALVALVALVAIGVVITLLASPRSGSPGIVIPTSTIASGTPTVTPAPESLPPAFTLESAALVIAGVLLLILALLIAVMLVMVGRRRREAVRGGVALATGPADVLEERITRLEQIRAWLKQDSSLMDMVDDVIGQNVRAAARAQMIFSAILGVVSLVVGWLLSAVTPPNVLLH